MRIGYSFWGFLGHGVTDTPDGGRCHRRTLIDALIAAGTTSCSCQPTATAPRPPPRWPIPGTAAVSRRSTC